MAAAAAAAKGSRCGAVRSLAIALSWLTRKGAGTRTVRTLQEHAGHITGSEAVRIHGRHFRLSSKRNATAPDTGPLDQFASPRKKKTVEAGGEVPSKSAKPTRRGTSAGVGRVVR